MPILRSHRTADTNRKKPKGIGGYELEPQGFDIIWGSDPRYWIVLDTGPAELIQVSWLEVRGSIIAEKGKTYKISFQVSLKVDSFGWNQTPAYVMAKVGKKGRYEFKRVILNEAGLFTIPFETLQIKVPLDAVDTQLCFGLYEVWSGKWKGGLEIYQAIVEPVE